MLEVVNCFHVDSFCNPLRCSQQWRFEGCNISDLSGFGNLHSLVLKACPYVQDVSSLAALNTVVLKSCHSIRDVSALASVRILSLAGCINVEDVSMLGNVEALCLKGCRSIKSIVGLDRVTKIQLPEQFQDDDHDDASNAINNVWDAAFYI